MMERKMKEIRKEKKKNEGKKEELN